MARFRKKPVVVEAVQWTGDNFREVEDFAKLSVAQVSSADPLKVHTREGSLHADVGDWIIKGVQGEFYPCKPDIFAATYEPVD